MFAEYVTLNRDNKTADLDVLMVMGSQQMYHLGSLTNHILLQRIVINTF